MTRIRLAARIFVGALLLTAMPLVAFAGGSGGTKLREVERIVQTGDVATTPVPEPGALLLFAAGAIVVGAAIRHKRRA